MKIETLKKRLNKNRQKTKVTLQIPEDVLADLEKLTPLLGFSNYQSLMRAYIGQGMRADLERFDNNTLEALIASLKRRGVSDEIINDALNEVL
ncbi:MAG: hypothetical protein SXA11_09430 [Cyanobacteriota bacterium]|nr:hypothetical protein [Cyanobacteriota bacterium]